MTFLEFKTELQKLESEFVKKERDLKIQFAKSNNPYNIGDVVIDHYQIGRITGMICDLGDTPSMIYKVILLNKDLTEKKRNSSGHIYQINVKDKLKEIQTEN